MYNVYGYKAGTKPELDLHALVQTFESKGAAVKHMLDLKQANLYRNFAVVSDKGSIIATTLDVLGLIKMDQIREQWEARTNNAGGEGTRGNDYANSKAEEIKRDADRQRIRSAANDGKSSG